MIEPSITDVRSIEIRKKDGGNYYFRNCCCGWEGGFYFVFETSDNGIKEAWFNTDDISEIEVRRYE